MKFFADTADLLEIRKLVEAGLLAGVAPELSTKFISGRFNTFNFDAIYQHIKADCPVIVKCTNNNYPSMLNEGQEFAKINKNIILTVPLTQDGLYACNALTEQKIQTNIALSCSITQALLAAEAGATYISIPADQLENTNDDGVLIIQEICDIYEKYEIETQILLVSINSSRQVEQAARIGVHAVAIPPSIFSEIIPMI